MGFVEETSGVAEDEKKTLLERGGVGRLLGEYYFDPHNKENDVNFVGPRN